MIGYDTCFAVPVYDDADELVRYNVFKVRILVRHAKKEIVSIKKKRAFIVLVALFDYCLKPETEYAEKLD